jgi:hypothetical protein
MASNDLPYNRGYTRKKKNTMVASHPLYAGLDHKLLPYRLQWRGCFTMCVVESKKPCPSVPDLTKAEKPLDLRAMLSV